MRRWLAIVFGMAAIASLLPAATAEGVNFIGLWAGLTALNFAIGVAAYLIGSRWRWKGGPYITAAWIVGLVAVAQTLGYLSN